MESNGWVMWKMGTWLMTHEFVVPAKLLLQIGRALCDLVANHGHGSRIDSLQDLGLSENVVYP